MRTMPRQTRGFLSLDITFGLVLVGVLLLVMTLTLAQHRRASLALADQREALRLAERALLQLQTAQTAPPDEPVTTRTVAHGEGPLAGYRWVEVQATHGRERATLMGLVPVPEVQP